MQEAKNQELGSLKHTEHDVFPQQYLGIYPILYEKCFLPCNGAINIFTRLLFFKPLVCTKLCAR